MASIFGELCRADLTGREVTLHLPRRVGVMGEMMILLPLRQTGDDIVWLCGHEHYMCKLRLSQSLLFVSVIDVRYHPIW